MKRTLTLLAALALVACKDDPPAPKAEQPAEAAEAEAPLPTSEAEFLAELIPLPEELEAVEVRYTITGPALSGEMTTLITKGGNKREHWELHGTAGEAGAKLSSAGTTIVNAEHAWSRTEGSPGEIRPSHLGPLARAFLALDPEARAKVVESIRAWHAGLIEQRSQSMNERASILGVDCLETRLAAQSVCMWEGTGLILRYEGSAFTIEAREIVRNPKIAPDAFELPPEAQQATRIELEDSPPIDDYPAVLAEIAAGSHAKVSLLVLVSKGLPRLSLPSGG